MARITGSSGMEVRGRGVTRGRSEEASYVSRVDRPADHRAYLVRLERYLHAHFPAHGLILKRPQSVADASCMGDTRECGAADGSSGNEVRAIGQPLQTRPQSRSRLTCTTGRRYDRARVLA